MLFSYHTHCEFCDGRTSASGMAAAAFKAGYAVIGFSSHAPIPFNTTWNLKWPRIKDYEKTIRDLAAEWGPRGMDILLGLEIDYIENVASPADDSYNAIKLDYKIGSTHYITGLPGKPFTVDETAEAFERHVNANSGGDAAPVWKEYYRRLTEMIEKGGFDIIGHFDLVKKNNVGARWFDEGSRAYTDSAFAAVDRAAELDCIAEVNTGGLARGKTKETYPSSAILKRMREKGLRLTIGDDAHAPGHLGAYQGAAVEAARAAGYRAVWYLDRERKWRDIGIEEAGKPEGTSR